MSFGWGYPPGVTPQMIDDEFGGDEEPCEECGCEPGSREDCVTCAEFREDDEPLP